MNAKSYDCNEGQRTDGFQTTIMNYVTFVTFALRTVSGASFRQILNTYCQVGLTTSTKSSIAWDVIDCKGINMRFLGQIKKINKIDNFRQKCKWLPFPLLLPLGFSLPDCSLYKRIEWISIISISSVLKGLFDHGGGDESFYRAFEFFHVRC